MSGVIFEPGFDPEEEALAFSNLSSQSDLQPTRESLDISEILNKLNGGVPLEAGPENCQEASPISQAFYVPCNAPATRKVEHRGEGVLRMCEPCADYNVRNRGARYAD